MKTQTAFLFLGVLAFGCGGKLAGSGDNGGSEETGTAVSGCGDAGPFVGTWTCNYTATPLIAGPPGTIYNPISTAAPFTFTEDDGGTLSLTMGRPANYSDAGPDAPDSFEGLTFTVSGSTATLDGTQSCWDEYEDNTVAYTGGTFTVSACSAATLSDLVVSGTSFPTTEPAPFKSSFSGTCTRN